MNGADEYTLPRSARIVARIWLTLAGLVLAVSAAAAFVMRAELWSPGAGWAPELYDAALRMHGTTIVSGALAPALLAGLGSLMIGDGLLAPASRAAWLSALAIVPWLGGVLLCVTLSPYDRGATSLTLWLFAASLALVTLHYFGVLAHPRLGGSSGFALVVVASFIGALLWQTAELSWAAFEEYGSIEDSLPRPLLDRFGVNGCSQFHLVIAAVAASAHCAARPTPTVAFPTALLYFGVGVVPLAWLFVAAWASLHDASADVHLHDTYFELGKLHLAGSIIVVALLAGFDAYATQLVGRRPRIRLARIGCVYVCLGTITTSVGMLMLGSQGMPRRYADYLPIFEPYHRAITIGAVLTAVGVLLALASVLFGERNARERGRSDGTKAADV